MREKGFRSEHYLGPQGLPAGGRAIGLGVRVAFNSAPRRLSKPDGTDVETLLEIALDRLLFYQTAVGGRFSVRQNEIAIERIQEALFWLDDRTRERKASGIEGTYDVPDEPVPAPVPVEEATITIDEEAQDGPEDGGTEAPDDVETSG